MKKEKNVELAVMETHYWHHYHQYNELRGHEVVYGYIKGDWLMTCEYKRRFLYAKKVISSCVVDNIHDMEQMVISLGGTFDKDEFINFLKNNHVSY